MQKKHAQIKTHFKKHVFIHTQNHKNDMFTIHAA